MSEQKEQQENSHEMGNAAMKKGNYIEAMIHYTKAVKQEPKNHLLYGNRSLAFLKADQYWHAHQDANKCIELEPQWAKGYYRRGEVEFATHHFSEAIISYRNAQIHAPEDGKIQDALSKAKSELKKQIKSEDRILPTGIVTGVVIGLVLVVGDEVLTDSPALGHYILKAIVLLAVVGLGYGAAIGYRYLLQSQRAGLLEPPIDLYPELAGDVEASAKTSTTSTSDQKRTRHGNQSIGRQRYRKGKS